MAVRRRYFRISIKEKTRIVEYDADDLEGLDEHDIADVLHEDVREFTEWSYDEVNKNGKTKKPKDP